jgi:hypothetical protein
MNHDLDWGLDEPLRFPVSADGWSNTRSPVVVRSMIKIGTCNDVLAFAAARSQLALQLIDVLVHEKEHDFCRAAHSLAPEAWRLLFYRGVYTIDALNLAAFSAETVLRNQCRPADEFEDPPSLWLGEEVSVDSLAAEAELSLRKLGASGCAAACTVLALAQQVGLSRSEVLRCEWWNPKWVSQLTRHVRFVP